MVRTEEGVFLVDYEEKNFDKKPEFKIHDKCVDAAFSADGQDLIIADATQLVFRKVDSGKKTVVPTDNKVMKTKLSSTGIFFQTLEKKSLQEYYSCVYDIKKRSKVFSIQLSNEEKQRWPNLLFSDDDSMAFILTSPSEISSFLCHEQFKEFRKFPVNNCEVLSVSPGYQGKFRLVAITPEKYDFSGKMLQKGRLKIFSTHANKFT